MLKSLELFGFKSFADRTLFEFSPGITCVVGPNGSGKSNVVDAIKWILGDQSAKSLRGKDMSDVIFNGSSGRRSSGFAEATLSFDNSQGLLPIDSSEVSIGRRLYQSGDSEYLLNGSAVRLKDIRDVFMGTGAGTAAYSIIEQGRVDQILQANPTTRRLVFEEAAGISKFKSRRIDAERRLERVAQNLLRLTDIVDEVETQLNSTRSQASKAARFREVSVELKSLWTGLAADDFRHDSSNLKRQQNQLENLKEQQLEILNLISEVESHKRETDRLISEMDDRLIGHERTIAQNRQAIATHQSTIHHQSTRQGEVDQEVARLRNQRANLAFRVREIDNEYRKIEKHLHEFASEHELARQAVETQEEEVHQIRLKVRQWRADIHELSQRRIEIDSLKSRGVARLAVLRAQVESFAVRQKDLQQELQQAEERVQDSNARLIERRKTVKQAEDAYREVQQIIQELQEKRTDLTSQKSLAEQQLIELRERRSADSARLSLLEELEQRHEGIAIGVQEILKRAASAHFPPWNRILGVVRDLIEVPMELAPIIDAALGERAQYLAISDLDALLDYLDRGPAPIDGRVGFVKVSQELKTQSKSSSDSSPLPSSAQIELTGQPGVYGRADRLIADTERSPGVASAVLSDTWIVESLDDARRILRELPQDARVRFVTLQGEVLAPSGELFVGNVPHEASIVSRKSELRQLRNGLHQLDRGIESLVKRQSILGDSITSKHDELAQVRRKLEEATSHLSECNTLLNAQEQERERLNGEYEEKLKHVENLLSQSHQTELEIETLQSEQEQYAVEAESIQAKISDLETQASAADEQVLQLTQTMKTQQLEMAKHEERLTSFRNSQGRIERESRQTRQQTEELNQRFRQALESSRKCLFEILRAESQIATHALALEGTIRETREFFLQRDQLRAERKDLAKQEEEAHRQRRALQDEQHEIEIQIQNLKHQMTASANRILEEFQTPLDQLVEKGASAYRIYLAERYGDAVATAVCAPEETQQSAGSGQDDTAEVEEQQLENVSSDDGNSEASHAEFSQDDDEDEQTEISDQMIVPDFAEIRDELEARVDRLRRKLKGMGHVNTEALENLEELETRYNTLNSQLLDLQEAKASLEDIIRKINGESERIFLSTFETIRGHFQELFRKLFGGGDADIILEDPEDVLECGIDIVARPPGKELRSISLLSGGEKTMTAVGLLFAMFKSKPSPYCVLDEVDAALDDANVDRYVTVVKEFVSMTQFVVITHRKRTMTAANVLYGVTMEQAGVSKRISVRFEDVNDNGEISSAA